jgi:N-methylhydantoinase A
MDIEQATAVSEASGSSARVGIDVGGTFTDLLALQAGELVMAKVPSTPADQSVGVVDALAASGVPAVAIEALSHGTTVATNALLERRGARTAIVTTEGFRDVLEIARQDRPALYDLALAPPPVLVPRGLRFTVRERMGRDGVIVPLEEEGCRQLVDDLRRADVEAVAVCLLFGYLHPAHEQRLGELLRERLPGVRVSLSSEVLPEFREYERFSTTVADAYLATRLELYLRRLETGLEAEGFPTPSVMQSSGGSTSIDGAIDRAAACVLSGPAGGVVGAAFVAEASGYGDLLTFDMGGTSTDVAAVLDGSVAITTASMVGGIPIRFPTVDIHSVSAGGGSIAWADEGGALRVGPQSAGAVPGPAAYDRGGTRPTVTDANLLLGYLSAEKVLGGQLQLRPDLSERVLAELGGQLGLSALEAALGVVEVADAEMTRALRVISVERGLDPRDFALVAFGGAGPLHACSLAAELGIDTVLVPKAAGVLSAFGLAVAEQRRDFVAPCRGEIDFGQLRELALEKLPGAKLELLLDARYHGQAFELTVPAEEWETRFHAAHERRYGFSMEGEEVEPMHLRVVATLPGRNPELAEPEPAGDPVRTRRLAYFAGEWTEAEVLDRTLMGRGSQVSGPAIVEFAEATCVVPAPWAGEIDPVGTLVLRRGA